MTESEWLVCADPLRMLTALRGNAAATDRKYRLFACACCRRIWDRFPDDRNRGLVVVVEDHPDGTFDHPAVRAAAVASSAAEGDCRQVPAYWVAKYLGRGFYKMSAAMSATIVCCKAMLLGERALGREVEAGLYGDGSAARLPGTLPPAARAEAAAQADLLRDVLGPLPFRAVTLDPSLLTSTVVALARQMYEGRDFSAMPILADALQDAGCASSDILDHCRGDAPHVRGCWVIDLLLDKGSR